MGVIIRDLSVKHSDCGSITISFVYDFQGSSNYFEMSGYNGIEEILRNICNIFDVDFNKFEEHIYHQQKG